MFYSNNTSWFTLRNNLFWSFESHLVWLVWNRPRLLIFGEYHKIYGFLNSSFPGLAIKFLDWKSLDAWNCSQYVFSNAASAKFWGLAMLEIGNGKIGTFLSNLTIIINIFKDIKKLMTFKGNSNFNVVLFISLLNELFCCCCCYCCCCWWNFTHIERLHGFPVPSSGQSQLRKRNMIWTISWSW